MPKPSYKGDIQWKQQRGTSFTADNNGKDTVTLIYRGPTDTALNFRSRWKKGVACPEPGFTHCTLTSSPNIKHDDHAYSTATLVFEGATIETSTDPEKKPVTTYSFEAQHASFCVTDKKSQNKKCWYTYYAKRMTAQYVTNVRPTKALAVNEAHAQAYLVNPLPVPIKREDFDKDFGNPKKAADLKHKVDYIVIFPDGAFSYTEEAGVFSVTEIFEVFIEGIED
jgi:hypothetical protein